MKETTSKETWREEFTKKAYEKVDTLCFHKKGIVRGGLYSDEVMRGPTEETVTLVKKEDVYLIVDEILQDFTQLLKAQEERCVELAWEYIVKATRAESWSREELGAALTSHDV